MKLSHTILPAALSAALLLCGCQSGGNSGDISSADTSPAQTTTSAATGETTASSTETAMAADTETTSAVSSEAVTTEAETQTTADDDAAGEESSPETEPATKLLPDFDLSEDMVITDIQFPTDENGVVIIDGSQETATGYMDPDEWT